MGQLRRYKERNVIGESHFAPELSDRNGCMSFFSCELVTCRTNGALPKLRLHVLLDYQRGFGLIEP